MNHYKGDPKKMTSRFESVCHTCQGKIAKGEEIIYWPSEKKAGHAKCDAKDYGDFLSAAHDEAVYNGMGNPYCG